MEYKILCGHTSHLTLEKEVNEHLAKGWQLYGNMVMAGGAGKAASFYQCLTKAKAK